MNYTLGIDIGGVIIDRVNDRSDTSFFGDNYLSSKACPNSFDTIGGLQQFFRTIFLVSRCGERTEAKTLEWLDHHNFYRRTGVQKSNVRFCRERHEKKGICQDLGITHFIDDRLEVLSYIVDIVPNLYLFRPQEKEVRKFSRFLPEVAVADSWSTCYKEIKNDIMKFEQYDRLKKNADDYAEGFGACILRYDNSAHISRAIQLYGYALKEAERLADERKIKTVKRIIHEYNVG